MKTTAELMAALPHVLAAPKDAAPVLQLCFRPDYGQRQFPDRQPLEGRWHRGVAGGLFPAVSLRRIGTRRAGGRGLRVTAHNFVARKAVGHRLGQRPT